MIAFCQSVFIKDYDDDDDNNAKSKKVFTFKKPGYLRKKVN